jgi:deoxycytidylate deaminase
VAVCKQCHDAIHGNSNAPTKSGSIPNQSSEGYFSQLATIIGDIATFQENVGQYLAQLSTASNGQPELLVNLEDAEQTLRKQAFQIKTELAGFNIQDAPTQATDAFIEDVTSYSEEIHDSFNDIISLLDLAAEIRQEILTEDEFTCPECNDSVTHDSIFCASCGTKLPEWETCPDCGESVNISDEFCSGCGTDLPDFDGDINNNLQELVDEFGALAESITTHSQIVKIMTNRITVQSGDIKPSNSTERIDWRYCPNCGFRHSVYKPSGGRTAECFLCEASWEKSGIISTQWEMKAGKHRGDKKSDSDWNKLGRQKNNEEEYISYAEDFDTMDSQRVARQFGN